MADKNKKVLVVGIAGALTDELRASIVDLLKDKKDIVLVEGAEIEKEIKTKDERIKELEDLNQVYITSNETLTAENETYAQVVADLSAELEQKDKSLKNGYLTVKSGKKTYRVLGKKFSYQGQEYTVDDLLKNQKLIDELVALGVGFIIEVKEEK